MPAIIKLNIIFKSDFKKSWEAADPGLKLWSPQ